MRAPNADALVDVVADEIIKENFFFMFERHTLVVRGLAVRFKKVQEGP